MKNFIDAGMTSDQLNSTIEAAAIFHTLSLNSKRKYPDIYKDLIMNMRLPIVNEKYLGPGRQLFINVLSKLPEFQIYLSSFKDLISAKMSCFGENLEDTWTTIIHYDLWNNNILFHNDDNGNVDGIKVLDYQFIRLANPFRDIIYLLATTCNLNRMTPEDLCTAAQFYLKKLNYYLELSGSDLILDESEFEKRLRDAALSEFGHLVMCLPLTTRNSDTDTEIDSMLENSMCFKRWVNVIKFYVYKKWLLWS